MKCIYQSVIVSVILWLMMNSVLASSTSKLSDPLEPLPIEDAFQWRAERIAPEKATLNINIADGYYIYRNKLQVKGGEILLPRGEVKKDPTFGQVQIWTGQLEIPVTISDSASSLIVSFQGCQEAGVCYPKTKLELTLSPLATNALQEKVNTSAETKLLTKSTSAVNPFAVAEQNELLPEAQAFTPQMTLANDGTVEVQWHIAEGYYLYTDKIKVLPVEAVEKVLKSDAEIYEDDFFGEQPIYRHQNGKIKIYLNQRAKSQLTVRYQGCADVGVCYPMMQHHFVLPTNFIANLKASKQLKPVGFIEKTLMDNTLLAVGTLLLAGIALAFTPCVLPMLPILLGMLHSQANLSRNRTIWLASSYVLGMAVMTALFGIVVALLGVNLQIVFQKWWLLVLFAAVFSLAGISMLGAFEMSVPMKLQNYVNRLQINMSGSKAINVFIVGALSILVVGPCVAPPLFAILTFASTTGNVVKSGLYLFSLGLGMGLPLIVFAVFSNKVLKTGKWSILLKQFMGWLLIGVALWLIGRILPGEFSLVLWGLWLLCVAFTLLKQTFSAGKVLQYGIVALLSVTGLVWVSGGLLGGSNPLNPFKVNNKIDYQYVNNKMELKQLIAENDIVLIDFYADWCISCKENETFVFNDPEVLARFKEIVVAKVDMTDTTSEHRALLKAYNIVGPPALIVYQKQQKTQQIIGRTTKEQLLSVLFSGT